MGNLSIGTTLQNGKYEIHRLLGQGGFGITYLATMNYLIQGTLGGIDGKATVAIKEFFMKDFCNRDEVTSKVHIPSIGSKEMVQRFMNKFIKEANTISSFRHENIVKVIDVFNENGTAYYVMEYIEGCSLQEWIKQKGAIGESEALTYIQQVALALDCIHQKRMNHLDVKPGNILRKPDASIVLIDFGLSKQYDEDGEQTSSTPVGVSVGYAPIEQSQPRGVGSFSASTDIYSLGATLYNLVTGKTPPDASDILDNGFPLLPGRISKTTANAIEMAMKPSRSSRPQTIKDFLTLLKAEEETVPIVEPKPEIQKREVTRIDEVVIESELSGSKSYIEKIENLGWWISSVVTACLFLLIGTYSWVILTPVLVAIGIIGFLISLFSIIRKWTFFLDSIRKKMIIYTVVLPFIVIAPVLYFLFALTGLLCLLLMLCLLKSIVCFLYIEKYRSLENQKQQINIMKGWRVEILFYPILLMFISGLWIWRYVDGSEIVSDFNTGSDLYIVCVIGVVFFSLFSFYRISFIWKKTMAII